MSAMCDKFTLVLIVRMLILRSRRTGLRDSGKGSTTQETLTVSVQLACLGRGLSAER
jgi:hypothetical protein